MLNKLAGPIAVLMVACATSMAAEVDLKDVKCAVSSKAANAAISADYKGCLLYTSPSPRDGLLSRMPSSA